MNPDPTEIQGPIGTTRILLQLGHTLTTKLLIGVGRTIFLLLAVRALATADYGAYSLVTTTLTFALILFGLNANVYIYRAVPGSSEEAGRRILISVAAFELSLAAVVTIAALSSGALGGFLDLLHAAAYERAFVLAIAWLLAELLDQELLSYLYARQQIERANVLDLTKQVLWIPLPLIIWWTTGRLALDQIVACALVGSVAGVVYGLIVARPRLMWPDPSILRRAITFAAPLVVPALGFYALKLADRYLLSATRSLEETGVYALAANFANLIYSLTALVIANTLLPAATRASNLGDIGERNRILWRILKYSVWTFLAGSLVFWAASGTILVALARQEYAVAGALFPWVACGFLAIIVSGPAHNALWLADRTRAILAIDVLSTLTGVGIDLALIPRYGGYGAAVATLCGFGFGAGVKFAVSGLWSEFDWRDLFSVRREIAGAWAVVRGVRRLAKP